MEGRLVCREWKVVLFSSPKVTQGLVGCADNNVKSLSLTLGRHQHVCILNHALASESRMAHGGNGGGIETAGAVIEARLQWPMN